MRGLILLAAAAAVAPTPAMAQTTAPPIGTPKPFKMPAIERVRLGNGMTIAFVPFGSVPQTTLVLTTFAG